MRGILVVVLLLSLNSAFAQDQVRAHGFSSGESQYMAEQNENMAKFQLSEPTLFADVTDPTTFELVQTTQVRAFAEYEKAGYLIISEGYSFGSEKAKLAMAKNLPEDMTLVVFSGKSKFGHGNRVRKRFKDIIDPSRIKVVHMPKGGRGFWARDGVPVPVIRTNQRGETLMTLVDARYYHRFEPDLEFGKLYKSPVSKHEYYFEGGNFMANSINGCLVVNKIETQQIPDSVFRDHYGCKKLTRLPHVRGIGHADETVKFLNDETVLTDEESYIEQLEADGYKVVRAPRADEKYETYVNSLIVNGTVFVPIFGESNDEKALQVYRDAGFSKVIGLDSKTLSNKGMGSLHCITMTYPQVDMDEILKKMGGHLL